jgi:predicted glycosyltransferase
MISQNLPSQNAVNISNLLNDNIPNNTSREKEIIDLGGLDEKECKMLFIGLVAGDKLLSNPKSKKIKSQIDDILRKTGGHPLSIELIAKNITSVEELEEISKSL